VYVGQAVGKMLDGMEEDAKAFVFGPLAIKMILEIICEYR
jgi:hypothetical protein